jgi:hypothetical protein
MEKFLVEKNAKIEVKNGQLRKFYKKKVFPFFYFQFNLLILIFQPRDYLKSEIFMTSPLLNFFEKGTPSHNFWACWCMVLFAMKMTENKKNTSSDHIRGSSVNDVTQLFDHF